MSEMTVQRGDPRDPQATALLHQSHALMRSFYAAEYNHFLEIDALLAAHIHFFVARLDEKTLGCAALASRRESRGFYGEIKSMFVHPDSRGQGLADALMKTLLEDARSQGMKAVKLETGDLLMTAHRLYRRHGFVDCGPFGDYKESKASVFMTKAL